ncbi:MAG: radical SAM protein, partial [Bacteroidetes bacterium]|nr:radical SAM protein [Bacteroidota bacterium]
EIIKYLTRYNDDMILQTLFVRGECNGQPVDNTTDEELNAWLEAVKTIKPKTVMVYTFSRETPHPGLEKVPLEELKSIAERVGKLGIEVQVSG